MRMAGADLLRSPGRRQLVCRGLLHARRPGRAGHTTMTSEWSSYPDSGEARDLVTPALTREVRGGGVVRDQDPQVVLADKQAANAVPPPDERVQWPQHTRHTHRRNGADKLFGNGIHLPADTAGELLAPVLRYLVERLVVASKVIGISRARATAAKRIRSRRSAIRQPRISSTLSRTCPSVTTTPRLQGPQQLEPLLHRSPDEHLVIRVGQIEQESGALRLGERGYQCLCDGRPADLKPVTQQSEQRGCADGGQRQPECTHVPGR